MSLASAGLASRLPGARAGALLLILLGGLWAAAVLGLDPRGLLPERGGSGLAGEFFGRALTPALTYEAAVPEGTVPLLVKALGAVRTTIVFAAAAASLSLLFGIPLGFLASAAFWRARPIRAAGIGGRARAVMFRSLHLSARVFIAVLRSVHELLWAVLLLAALGFTPVAAVVAIAIPFAGTVAKVFSEILDEAPRAAGSALRLAGAGRLQIFCFGLLPVVLPDLSAYAFYRFECAVRASAVLGFFGFPTLGYYLSASFENLHYGEVWTYLYTLFVLVMALDWWSGRLRRRMIS